MMSRIENSSVELQGRFIETVPIFINVRDRLSCLKQLISWLEAAGHYNITLIDNASTYPPLIDFIKNTSYRTIWLRRNLGHTALWRLPELSSTISRQWFVYTDPDVIPAEKCPLHVVAYLYSLLQKFPNYLKAGLGLKIDDLPESYHLKQHVIRWEDGLYGREIAPDVFQADVDTTFALHRPGTPYIVGPAMRLRGRYEARHLPWYVDSSQPDLEEQYYRDHASSQVTNWNTAGEMKLVKGAGRGGVAARMEADPQAMLKEILESKSGRVMLLLRFSRRLFLLHAKPRIIDNSRNSDQVTQDILEILTSKDWKMAWQILNPLRTIKLLYLRLIRA